jgi:hypothetical protein
MNKKEAREYIIEKTEGNLKNYSFELVKSIKQFVRYNKKNRTGNTDFIGIVPYCSSFVNIGVGLNKRIDAVENILIDISKTIKLDPIPDSEHSSFHVDDINLKNLNESNSYMKFDDEGVEFIAIDVAIRNTLTYLVEFGIPTLEKFDDIRAIDNLINGENFWQTDWQMPYTLGGNFYIKRLIIAKLAGNKNYEELLDKQYKAIEKASFDNGYPFTYNRNDLTLEIPYTIEILKSVKSLY